MIVSDSVITNTRYSGQNANTLNVNGSLTVTALGFATYLNLNSCHPGF